MNNYYIYRLSLRPYSIFFDFYNEEQQINFEVTFRDSLNGMRAYRDLNDRFDKHRILRIGANPSDVMELYQERKIKLNKENLENELKDGEQNE